MYNIYVYETLVPVWSGMLPSGRSRRRMISEMQWKLELGLCCKEKWYDWVGDVALFGDGAHHSLFLWLGWCLWRGRISIVWIGLEHNASDWWLGFHQLTLLILRASRVCRTSWVKNVREGMSSSHAGRDLLDVLRVELEANLVALVIIYTHTHIERERETGMNSKWTIF